MTDRLTIQRMTVIGVGLIGGSLARALRLRGDIGEIVGCGRSVAHLKEAQTLGVIDRYETDAGRAVAGADLVVIAVPVGTTAAVLSAVRGHLGAETVVTDVGSVKGTVAAAAQQTLGDHHPWFVPGHPIAGTERSGVAASFAELFQRRCVILTPTAATAPRALALVRRVWETVGAEVVEMTVEHHDQVLAATSHLPHMLAYTLVDTLARMEDQREIFRYAAGGFRDFTRIASSDPAMWRDICLANREAMLTMLTRFQEDLQALGRVIEAGDGEGLFEIFARAKGVRDRLAAKGHP